jgi:hypothetical protein
VSHALGQIVTHGDVEQTIRALFSTEDIFDLLVRVQGADDGEERNDAFAELLDSLAMYGGNDLNGRDLVVAPPNKQAITRALSVLGDQAPAAPAVRAHPAHLRPTAGRSTGGDPGPRAGRPVAHAHGLLAPATL